MFCEVTVTFTFDLQNLISISILESLWIFVPNFKDFPQGVLEISHLQEWDGQADSKLSLKTKPADC